jgi:hypothetical protein
MRAETGREEAVPLFCFGTQPIAVLRARRAKVQTRKECRPQLRRRRVGMNLAVLINTEGLCLATGIENPRTVRVRKGEGYYHGKTCDRSFQDACGRRGGR